MNSLCKRYLVPVILLFLVACPSSSSPVEGGDNNSGAPGTLSGTLSAPEGGSVTGSSIYLCFIANNACDFASPNTQKLDVTTEGSSFSFTASNLAAGSYTVSAFKDVTGEGYFGESGDYEGCHGSCTNPTPVTPPATSVSVQLAIVGGSGPETPTGPGISGTLIFPGLGGADASESTDALPQVLGSQRLDAGRVYEQAVTLPDPSADVIPGEVIVKFKSAELQTQAVQEPLAAYTFKSASLSRVRPMALAGTALYKANLSVADTLALVEDLQARPDVVYAQPNTMMYALKQPNDSSYGIQWHYPAMNLENAWDIEDGTSNPVTVAVIDTGAIPHPDLQGTFVGGYDFISNPSISGDGDGRDADPLDLGQDSGYHGAHVAGTIAAQTNNGEGLAGVSWGAKVVPIRALGITGGGSNADILDAALWAGGISVPGVPDNPNPAKILNLSLGGGGLCSAAEQDVYKRLFDAGVSVVVAAGNEKSDAGFVSPASCDNVITVGATGPTNQRAPYSNFGSVVDVMATGGDINQSIPFEGENWSAGVWSTIKDDASGNFVYASYQGTSMAAPHIAGIAALMLAKDPSLTPSQISARLVDSATPLSAEACNRPAATDCGAGLVDAAKALDSTSTGPGAPPAPPPPPPTSEVITYIGAFYCINPECDDVNFDLSVLVTISNAQQQTPYLIDTLQTGRYFVEAWQDLNGDREIQADEPYGFVDEIVAYQAGETVMGKNLFMYADISSSTTNPTGVDSSSFAATLEALASRRVVPPAPARDITLPRLDD